MTKLRERSSRNVFHAHKREDFSFATEMGRDNDASAGKPKGCRDSRNQEHNRSWSHDGAEFCSGSCWNREVLGHRVWSSGSVLDRLGNCPSDRVVR